MFFNKLKEEIQNWVYVKLAKLEDKFMQRVADAIKASSQTPEELIKKYKHTQWYEVSPLVTTILEDRFNLTTAIPLAIYKGDKTVSGSSSETYAFTFLAQRRTPAIHKSSFGCRIPLLSARSRDAETSRTSVKTG